jgi:hypothetical protein
MRIIHSATFIAIMVVSLYAFASDYTSVKQLMVRAIDAADGKASGFVLGQIADKFQRTTGSSAPVRAEVTTIKSFQQEGCKRLNVRITQSGVPTSDGKSVDFGIDYGLNMCRDGSPPTEGMDLEQASSVLEEVGRGK